MSSAGVPLSDSLWAELYEGQPSLPENKLTKEEWEWLKQVVDLRADLSKILQPKVTFQMSHAAFWISLAPSDRFPQTAPRVKCAYEAAFVFDWLPDSCTLSTVVSQYRDIAEQMDAAVGELKSLDGPVFQLLQHSLVDSDFIEVDLLLQESGDEVIRAKIDWRAPGQFPDALSSTNSRRFDGLDSDRWQEEAPLLDNFAAICGIQLEGQLFFSLPKDGPLSGKSLHSIPCKIDYTGPANISGYFLYSQAETGQMNAAIRGRGLCGAEFTCPEGYELFVLKEKANSTGETRCFTVVDSKSAFNFWEWDREAGSASTPARLFSSLPVSRALSDD